MIENFDFNLPTDLIAGSPASPRDHSKLLRVDRLTGASSHHHFYDLPNLLTANDVLVFNQSKVFPARLFGTKDTSPSNSTSGGKVQILLIKKLDPVTWQAISKPGLKLHQYLHFSPEVTAQVVSINSDHTVNLQFNSLSDQQLNQLGTTPIPPYIISSLSENHLRQAYQTTYAKDVGSAAAPTAGLHFTDRLLRALHLRGVQTEFVTLHVGLGTFKPLKEENFVTGKLHSEYYQVDSDTAQRLNLAKAAGKRIIAVGTTTTRVLETATCVGAHQDAPYLDLKRLNGDTSIFIYPPYQFKFVDGLITNFHLPKSSLLMLVSAFVAKPEFIINAYQTAIKNRYRFYSFGDAMLLV